ncbi:MAG: DUF3347 domain-containing protein [Cyclobacteriaceae bacterium]|nr:DUF3347 domain-containing protein [Cyclobacteriaceae bacterium]
MKMLKTIVFTLVVLLAQQLYAQTGNETARKVLTAYLDIKEALVATDIKAAAGSARSIQTVIGKSQEELLVKIYADAATIVASTTVEGQRSAFKTLSENVYQLIRSTQANEATLYRQYCPMAEKNTGGYWLSVSKEIRNPYFGDRMLMCGSVKEEIN